MMNLSRWTSVTLVALVLGSVACNSKEEASTESLKPTTSTDGKPSDPAKSTTPDAKPNAKPDDSKSDQSKTETASTPAPKPSELPAEVKHEGFEYYGLGMSKPLDLELRDSINPDRKTGSRIFELKKVEAGKAYYTETHTGGLSGAGDYDLMVDKTGVYVVKSAMVQLDSPQLEIPAKLTPGFKWHVKSDLENTDYTVVGPSKVKTKLGDRDAILITGSGTVKKGSDLVVVESKFWCVKGVGQVKIELKTHPKANQGKPETVTMEEVKTP